MQTTRTPASAGSPGLQSTTSRSPATGKNGSCWWRAHEPARATRQATRAPVRWHPPAPGAGRKHRYGIGDEAGGFQKSAAPVFRYWRQETATARPRLAPEIAAAAADP